MPTPDAVIWCSVDEDSPPFVVRVRKIQRSSYDRRFPCREDFEREGVALANLFYERTPWPFVRALRDRLLQRYAADGDFD